MSRVGQEPERKGKEGKDMTIPDEGLVPIMRRRKQEAPVAWL